jgi:hypothetical protein
MKSRFNQNYDGLFPTRVQPKSEYLYNLLLALCFTTVILLAGCSPTEKTDHKPNGEQTSNPQASLCGQNNKQDKSNTITAEVVALEQIITFNRFGAFNPAGMVYALRQDVVYDDPKTK